MRGWIGLGLLAALAWPAAALDASPGDRAEDLRSAVQGERFRLEGEATKDARAAVRFLGRSERALGKLIKRYGADDGIDHKKLALFAKAGQWIGRARGTGQVAADAPLVAQWAAWLDACAPTVDDFVDDAVASRDRVVNDKFRQKVTRRLDKGLALYDGVATAPTALDRVRLMAKAVQQVEAAYRRALAFLAKESRPNCPRGLLADNEKLSYRGRGALTVFDLEWHIVLRTRDGVIVAERDGQLSSPGRILPTPLPWHISRGEALDALNAADVPLGFGHRMDGVLTWRTSAGDIDVLLHIDQ